jgi:multidrug resistance efflux pump
MKISEYLDNALALLFRVWTKPLIQFGVKNGKAHIVILPERGDQVGADERIRKIDEARNNLASALTAMDELKEEANTTKAEAEALREKVSSLIYEKNLASNELNEIQNLVESNIGVFQRLTGVPTRKQIAKERFVGFALGILASLIASLLWEIWPLLLSVF